MESKNRLLKKNNCIDGVDMDELKASINEMPKEIRDFMIELPELMTKEAKAFTTRQDLFNELTNRS